MKLTGYKVIKGILKCETGLHIGGSADQIEIGGVDLPIIKHPITGEPFVPGSSLKGKMRSQLEKINIQNRLDALDAEIKKLVGNDKQSQDAKRNYDKRKKQLLDGEPCGCGLSDCNICKVYGPHKNPNHNLGSTRILVRDALFNKNTRDKYEQLAKEKGQSYIEKKTENLVLRTTGTAKDPRSQERVPSGAEFDIEVVLQIYDTDGDGSALVDFVKEGLKQVQSTYLGGFGSRGSGKVSFKDMKLDGTDFTL